MITMMIMMIVVNFVLLLLLFMLAIVILSKISKTCVRGPKLNLIFVVVDFAVSYDDNDFVQDLKDDL